ncbi:Cas9 inhibitor AcrIIA9 family protein [uncultured Mitsuokella sp.]|uniref:Cas9 inhibitor AcrIIA9 family protein n=1 Tax=uncultured Mitsuokella sp. TaxID=453120 RepID=UPI00266ECB15|nr:Cas9 inhibitor AcrIIA9 family protein [uncultured Mitsuokella sp.]
MSDIKKYKAAVEAIENEDLKPGSPEYAIACIVRAWLDYRPEDAAERVLAEGKSVADCYKYTRQHAKAIHDTQGGSCVGVSADTMLEWILEYYGYTKDEAQTLIEGGLMMAVYQAMARSWTPYGMETEKAQPDAGGKQKTRTATFDADLEDLL